MVDNIFFDFHVHVKRGNEKLIMEAKRLGYNGIAVVKYADEYDKKAQSDFKRLKNEFEKQDFQIRSAVELAVKNPEDLKRKTQKFRGKTDVLIVRGGDIKINRAACEDPRIDILSKPYKGRRDGGINHVLAKKAAENDVAIELNLKYLLKTGLRHRYKVFNQFRSIIKLQRKFNFPVIITSDATSIYDFRTPQDIIALSQCFQMTEGEAEHALSETPQSIIKKNEMRDSVVLSGVRVIEP